MEYVAWIHHATVLNRWCERAMVLLNLLIPRLSFVSMSSMVMRIVMEEMRGKASLLYDWSREMTLC